jgi:hypothetical protein
MTEKYGPDDASVPEWEAPTGSPMAEPPRWSSPSPTAGPAAPRVPGYGPPSGQPTGIPTYRSWQPGFMPLRPLQLGDFISLPMKAIQLNRPAIIGGPLLCMLITLAPIGVAVWLFANDWYRVFVYGHDPYMPSGQTLLAIAIASIVFILADAAARVFVIPGVSRGILGQRLTLSQAWAIARPRIPQVLLLYLLVGLIAAGGILGIIIIAGGLGASGAEALAILIMIGLIPFVIMGTVVVYVAVAIVVLERSKASAALGRAYSLVKGNAWRLTGSILVIQLVVGIISQVVSALAETVISSAMGSSPSISEFAVVLMISFWITTLVSVILSYAFVGTVTTLMYVDLRIRNEGFDVDLARAAEAAARR